MSRNHARTHIDLAALFVAREALGKRADPRGMRRVAMRAADTGSLRPRYDLAVMQGLRVKFGRRRDPFKIRFAGKPSVGGDLELFTLRSMIKTEADCAPRQQYRAVQLIEGPDRYILVVTEQTSDGPTDADRESLAAARLLARTGTAIAVMTPFVNEEAWGAAGADRIVVTSSLSDRFENSLDWAKLVAVMEVLQPEHLLLPSSPACNHAALRIAAATDSDLFLDADQIGTSEVARTWQHGMVSSRPTRIMTLKRGCAAPDRTQCFEGRVLDVPVTPVERLESELEDFGLIQTDVRFLPLAEAEFIVAVGAGVKNISALCQLADRLGATIGATRVVCDNGALPRDRQVGASGTIVRANIYVALGISGAVQHLQGIESCRDLIAINIDAYAPIMRRANVALVTDADKMISAVLSRLGETTCAP